MKDGEIMDPRISIITLSVEDLDRSYNFYHNGLGIPTTRNPNQGIIFFQTNGTCLALYPKEKMKEEFEAKAHFHSKSEVFGGITLAHNVENKEEVIKVINLARKAGATIQKEPCDTFWGGFSGYFSYPGGYLWEVASGAFDFNEDGSLKIT